MVRLGGYLNAYGRQRPQTSVGAQESEPFSVYVVLEESGPMPHSSIPAIVVPEDVRQTGTLPVRSLTPSALSHLHQSDVVVLGNAVNKVHLDHLNAALAPNAARSAETPGQHSNFGFHTGNINQGPPLNESLIFSDVWINPVRLVCFGRNSKSYPGLTLRLREHCAAGHPYWATAAAF
ncbi:hypothetical protein DL768_010444 [Monosporascus sp. mg162]|nr:hypothetical protein DL768_010444 [Monosporascus sp. mg162]